MPKDTDARTPEAADARHAELGGDESVIPRGLYCYEALGTDIDPETGFPRMRTKPCPYWAMHPDKPRQLNGYCAKLKSGDWSDAGLSLLWDRVKECGINEDADIDPEDVIAVADHP